MGAAERRNKIITILYRRGHVSMADLAREFGVSYSTIRRDIDALTFGNYLTIKRGRYDAGVYVDFAGTAKLTATTEEQLLVLHKIYDFAQHQSECILSDNEIRALEAVIARYMTRDKKG